MMQSESGDMVQMPRYKCHKEVWALKIASITFDSERRGPNDETDGTAVFKSVEDGYAPFLLSADFVHRHLHGLTKEQIIGGYYVVYADGYVSFSPAKAFEEGYTKI